MSQYNDENEIENLGNIWNNENNCSRSTISAIAALVSEATAAERKEQLYCHKQSCSLFTNGSIVLASRLASSNVAIQE